MFAGEVVEGKNPVAKSRSQVSVGSKIRISQRPFSPSAQIKHNLLIIPTNRKPYLRFLQTTKNNFFDKAKHIKQILTRTREHSQRFTNNLSALPAVCERLPEALSSASWAPNCCRCWNERGRRFNSFEIKNYAEYVEPIARTPYGRSIQHEGNKHICTAK